MNIYKGDCLEVMKDIPDESIDAIITDPPYGTTACAWDSVIPFEPMWEQLKRVIKKNGAIALFGSQPFTSALIMSNIKMYRYDIYWQKSNAVGHLNANRMPMRVIELISVFYKKLPTYNPQFNIKPAANQRHRKGDERIRITPINGVYRSAEKINIRQIEDGLSYPSNLISFISGQEKHHPTQKPVALIEYLIKTYTNKGDTVLDFTMGSGTTAVTCLNTEREFIGIELDEGYFNIAKKRIAEHKANGIQMELMAI